MGGEATSAEILKAVNNLAQNVATKEDLEKIEKQLCDFDVVLFRGNSHPPIVPQVRQMREEMDEVKAKSSKKGDFFLEKLLAPVITGLTVAIAMLIIGQYLVK